MFHFEHLKFKLHCYLETRLCTQFRLAPVEPRVWIDKVFVTGPVDIVVSGAGDNEATWRS